MGQKLDKPEVERRRFRPYPKYKDSGVEWLGKVPQAWEVCRLKHISSINDDVLPENTDPLYEINYADIGGVDQFKGIVCIEKYSFGAAPSRARRKVKDGDVIVSTVRTYLRSIANIEMPAANLIVSTGFAVLRPGPQLNNCYASYALRASYFIEKIVANTVGVSYPAIDASKISTIEIACPPIVEQIAIASFLNRETAKIDALIEKKERLIELLKEKRTALITQAVTKGLDPNVPMKDSGVEWLGKIPALWQTKRLKNVGVALIGLTFEPADVVNSGQGVFVLRASNIVNGRISLNDSVYVKCPIPERLITHEGDILICSRSGSRKLIGKCAIVEKTLERLTFGVFMTVFRSALNKYLYYVMNSTLFSFQSGAFLTSTINQLTINDLNTLLVPIPPYNERDAITIFLDRETAKIDKLVLKTHEAIDRLKEYRTALISAAVTGKIDVRDSQSPGPRRN